MKKQPPLEFCPHCGAERQAMECITVLLEICVSMDPLRERVGENAVQRMRAMIRAPEARAAPSTQPQGKETPAK